MSTITKAFTKEQLLTQAQENVAQWRDAMQHNVNTEYAAIRLRLAEIALASLEAEPVSFDELRDAVAEVSGGPAMEWSDIYKGHQAVPFINFNSLARIVDKFRPAPPAPVVPAELHPDTQKLVTDFCTALAEKLYKAQLKYGYDADWKQDGWPTQCQAHFHQHIAKGDPRDVAAYCAFMWYHGWKTEPAPVSVPDEATPENIEILASTYAPRGITYQWDRDECNAAADSWNACRAAMLQGAEHVSNRDELTDGWVVCNERMPSPSTGVIVAAPWQSAPGGYAMKWATNCPGHPDADIDGWIIPGASWSPTHWMPLPSPPAK